MKLRAVRVHSARQSSIAAATPVKRIVIGRSLPMRIKEVPLVDVDIEGLVAANIQVIPTRPNGSAD